MNWPKKTMILVFLVTIGTSQVAWARWRGGGHHDHNWRGNFDIVIGVPLGWGYYPPPYYPYPPPVIVSPPPPPVYIEQAPTREVNPPPKNYWYYCTNPPGYYPTIKECPDGWLKVVPQTQPNSQ